MTIVIQESFLVKPEKQAEFTKLMNRMLKYMKDNPKLFKELKSAKNFTQTFGGTYGTHITLMEFNSLTDMEKLDKRTMKDKTLIRIYNEMMPLIESTTYTSNIWTPIE